MAAKRSAGQPPAKRSRHQASSYHSLDRLLVYKLDRPVEMIQRARGARLRASGAGWIATDICRYRSPCAVRADLFPSARLAAGMYVDGVWHLYMTP